MFLVYSRAAASAAHVEDDPALDEEHWSYMDQFAAGMVARGPTLGPDRETWTGSLHIVDLPSAEAAREFAEREPYNRAGLFDEHVIRRFENLLGRTMWEWPRESSEPRFFVIAYGPVDLDALPHERLIVLGELLTPDEATPTGVALALEAPTREHVDAFLRDAVDERFDIEIHDWEFGGRR